MYLHPSGTTESSATPIVVPTVIFFLLFLLGTGLTIAGALLFYWKSRHASCTLKEASEYATVYISREFLDSAENKVQKGDSLENIYDSVDELSIREVENATEESCGTKVVSQCMKTASDAVGATEDTASKLLDERCVPPDAGGSESTYQEIADPSIQSSTYAHLYSTLPLHQGERADTLHQGERADSLHQGERADTLHQGERADTLHQGERADTLHQGERADTLHQGERADTLHQGERADTLHQGERADTLHQGERADTLHQDAADVTETESNKEDRAPISDGEDTASGSRDKQEQL